MGSEFCQWGHHGLHIAAIFGIIPKQFSSPWGKPPSGHVCFCVLLVSCGELRMILCIVGGKIGRTIFVLFVGSLIFAK